MLIEILKGITNVLLNSHTINRYPNCIINKTTVSVPLV